MSVIPESYLDLLQQKPAFAHLATIREDGTPQVTPVWFDYDGEFLYVDSAEGRLKDRNIRRDPRVTLEIQDPANPYRYIEIRGVVEVVTKDGAVEMIDKLSMKYLGQEKYPFARPGEVRVLYKIRPLKAHGI
jgi:PPOX class probable F420-dependent enzyme